MGEVKRKGGSFMRINTKGNNPFGKKLRESDPQVDLMISDNLDDNEAVMSLQFAKCSDLVVRRLQIFGSKPGMVVFLRVLVDKQLWDDGFLTPLMQKEAIPLDDPSQLYEQLK